MLLVGTEIFLSGGVTVTTGWGGRPHALTRTYTQPLNILTGTIPKHMLNRLGFTQCVPPTVTAICQISQIKDLYFFCTMTTQLVILQESSYSCSGCCLRKLLDIFLDLAFVKSC